MAIRKVGTRATIPAAIHGLSGTAVIRGACIWQGDLYLYLFDEGSASFMRAALNGTDLGYEVEEADYDTWDVPWVMTQPEQAHAGNRRLYSGLHIHEGWVQLVTPDEDGYAVTHLVPWEGGDQIEDLVISTLDMDYFAKGAIQYRPVAYEALYGIRMLDYGQMYAVAGAVQAGGDVIDGPFDTVSALFLRDMASNRYRMSTSRFIEDVPEDGIPWSILKSGDNAIILKRDAAYPIAKKVGDVLERSNKNLAELFGSVQWGSIGSVNVQYDGLDAYRLVVHEYTDSYDKFFYTVSFGISNEIVVDMYRDNATGCSSPKSSVTQSLDVMKFSDLKVNRIDATFIDGFGMLVPENTVVLAYISTQGQPLAGSVSVYPEGPFFDTGGDPLRDHVWVLTDVNGAATVYYASPRTVGDAGYTESLTVVAGFEQYGEYEYPD